MVVPEICVDGLILMVIGMTRKFWITIAKDEDLDTRFRISLLPFRYRKAPATMSKLAFVSERSFASERDAIERARAVFGNIS